MTRQNERETDGKAFRRYLIVISIYGEGRAIDQIWLRQLSDLSPIVPFLYTRQNAFDTDMVATLRE